jgi:hypothetical protein
MMVEPKALAHRFPRLLESSVPEAVRGWVEDSNETRGERRLYLSGLKIAMVLMKMIPLADQRSIGPNDIEWKEAGVAKMVEVDLAGQIPLADKMVERVDMACGDKERLV